jgi:hypothetical protein
MYPHFLFFLLLFYFIFLFFGTGPGLARPSIYFFEPSPAQPTWTGLGPASPARSLAQASDPAGQRHAQHVRKGFLKCMAIVSNELNCRMGKDELTWSARRWRRWRSSDWPTTSSTLLLLLLSFVSF